ncbi:MAG: L7Ae/L30e/S12e/Gadd45 family ribosomal protein [Lachnospirales bacterium]
MDRNVKTMLGLARRSNAVKTGDFIVSKLISSKKAKIVIVAKDSGYNTKKKFANSCHFYGANLVSYSTKEELSLVLGKQNVAVLAIEDENFASRIGTLIIEDETDKVIVDDFDYKINVENIEMGESEK